MVTSLRLWAALLIGAGSAVAPVSASETVKLVPAETELILTINVRQFLVDHKNTPLVQRYLDQWRLAVKGDEQQLRKFYRDQEVQNTEGLTEQEFLKRASQFKSVSDALGLDLLEDVDRITWAGRPGAAGFSILVVEGRFKEGKFTSGIKQLAREHFGSFKVARAGALEIWQVPDRAEAVHLALWKARALVVTGDKKTMDAVLARAVDQKDRGLSPGLQTLLARAEREHVALLGNNIDVFLKDMVKVWQEEIARGLAPSDMAGKFLVNEGAAWVRKYAPDLSCASLGLSLGEEELKLHFGLEVKKPALAREWRTLIQRSNFWSALVLKAIGKDLTQQLGDILLRQRVVVKDGTLIVQTEVPYEFIQLVMKEPWVKPFFPDAHPDAVQFPSPLLGQAVMDVLSRHVTSIPLWGPATPRLPGALAVTEVRDIAYYTGPGADPIRHRLDLLLPRDRKDFPVVVLVHGGAWVVGDNRCCGLYSSVAHFLASQGIGVVLPNYRLSPEFKHPHHVQDVARAVAWTRTHVAKYGGNPRRLFLMGHSAGGHLVALLATDESYLKAEGLKSADLQGVIAVSGPYHLPHGMMRLTLGGSAPRAFGVDQLFPIRGASSLLVVPPLPGFPVRIDLFGPVFGNDPKVRDQASPLTHVRPGLPPFLLLVAQHDLPTLAGMADEFHHALERAGCDVQLRKIDRRNHNSLLFSAIQPDDPAARAIVDFLRARGKMDQGR